MPSRNTVLVTNEVRFELKLGNIVRVLANIGSPIENIGRVHGNFIRVQNSRTLAGYPGTSLEYRTQGHRRITKEPPLGVLGVCGVHISGRDIR